MSTTSHLDEPIDEPIDQPIVGPIDGRTARAMRTRDRLVDATIELVEAGDLRPTAPRIAERAGVSVRSVFQHFDDLESLFTAMGEQVFERLAALVGPIDASAPLADRVRAFVAQRAEIHEAVTPISRAAILQQPTSGTINRQFRQGHAFITAHVAEVFAPELEAAGDGEPALLDALVVACSWSTWNLLRTLGRREVDEASRVVSETMALLFAGAGSPVVSAAKLADGGS